VDGGSAIVASYSTGAPGRSAVETSSTDVSAGVGEGDGDGDGDGDGGAGQPVDDRIDSRFTTDWHPGMGPVQNTQFNVYSPTNYITCCEAPGSIHFANFQTYYDYVDEEHMILGESWSMPDDTTLRMTFRDDIEWWDGTPVTTRDIEVMERLDDVIRDINTPPEDQPDPPFVEDWNIVDERTWELDLVEPFSEDYAQFGLVQGRVNVKADLYEPYVEELEELLYEDEDRSGAEEALVGFLETRFEFDQVYGNGPFKYVDHDDTRYIMEVNEAYPYSDTIKFSEFAWRDVGQETSQRAETFIAGEIDGVFAWQPSDNLLTRAENNLGRLEKVRMDNALVFGYHINLGIYDLPEVTAPTGVYEPITGEPEGWLVRKAIAYALDGAQNARALEGTHYGLETPTAGWPIQALRQGNGPLDWMEETLENYQAEAQPEKARELMETAGLTYDEDEDTWYDRDGEEITFILKTSTDPTFEQVYQQNLEEIGLNVDLQVTENFGSERHQGEFDVIPDNGSGTSPKSTFGTFPIGDWYAKKYNGPSGSRPTRTWAVPTPVGNTDVTDPAEREEWNMSQTWSEFLKTGDEQLVKELMWMRNQYLTTVEWGVEVQEGAVNGSWWYVDGPRGLRHNYQPWAHLLQAEEGVIAPQAGVDYHPNQ